MQLHMLSDLFLLSPEQCYSGHSQNVQPAERSATLSKRERHTLNAVSAKCHRTGTWEDTEIHGVSD